MNSLSTVSSNLIEIFSSIQGEGPYVGTRQLFVRFAGCNLQCGYCDTDFQNKEKCTVETLPGSKRFKEINNPVYSLDLVKIINSFAAIKHHSIALTGGEPLMSSDFLSYFFADYSKSRLDKGMKIFLESNGTLPARLEQISPYIDICSMDIKLESSTGQTTPWDVHSRFIDVAISNSIELYVKVVITSRITFQEVNTLVDLILSKNTNIPLILQPITSADEVTRPKNAQILKLQEMILSRLTDVRVIPQTHRYLGVL